MTEDDLKILLKFAERLKELRKARNLSYRQLALESELDHAQIQKIEAGKRMPSLPILVKLANGLNLSVSELLKGM